MYSYEPIHVLWPCLSMTQFFFSLQMARNIDDVRDYEVGQEFMRYILNHPEAKDEPEDYLFEEFDPEAE